MEWYRIVQERKRYEELLPEEGVEDLDQNTTSLFDKVALLGSCKLNVFDSHSKSREVLEDNEVSIFFWDNDLH